MYLCECGCVFEKPNYVMEDHGERTPVCPACVIGYFYDANLCKRCGKWFDSEYDFEVLCPKCKPIVVDEFREKLMIAYKYDTDAIELAAHAMDGETFLR